MPFSAANRRLVIRAVNIGTLLILICILFLSFWLHADPRGLGTHEQLFLRPCNFYILTGLPCPSCGMTTAFAHMAHGEVVKALKAQPMGAIGFVGCIILIPLIMVATLKDRYFFLTFMNLPWKQLSWALGLMFALAWMYKLSVFLLR